MHKKSFDSQSAINPQFDKSDGDSEDLSDCGSDQGAKYRSKIRKEQKNKSEVASQKRGGTNKKKKKPLANEPIPEPGPEEGKEEDETPVVDKVASWFKDLFNVCGNSSCCASSNPYYDKKSWNDLSGRISYANEEIEKEEEEKRRATQQPKL